MSAHKTKLIVAAIDFGTTYSGYAYTFRDDYERDPKKIYTNEWPDGSGLITHKTPTAILFDGNGKFHSFGYEAEEKYAELAADNKHENWKYFRRFKMKLHTQEKIRKDMRLNSERSTTEGMPALDVFAAAIKYLKDHLMERLNDRLGDDIFESDIDWVITVPAIWKDEAKLFMLEAAKKAGIPLDQLQLALEPEAAAIYCKVTSVSRASETDHSAQLRTFKPGAQFMVLDLGGGTVDITVHEFQKDGSLKELNPPSGGPWGGTTVDKHIYEMFENLFGQTVVDKFRDECQSEDVDLQRAVELKKRKFKYTPDSKSSKVNLAFPAAIFKTFKKVKKSNFETSLSQSDFATSVNKSRDKLQFDPEIFLDCFNESKTELLKLVRCLLQKPEVRNVKTIFMVGGFSESDIMKASVTEEFERTLSVIVPEEASAAVVKGAVMYGFNNKTISSRKLRYTYGVSTAVPFDDRKHPVSKKVWRDGVCKCEDVFKVFLKLGSTVVLNETKAEYTFYATTAGSSTTAVDIYRSELEEPMYVAADNCQRIGEVVMQLQNVQYGVKQMITVTMWFGDTVLHVEAREAGTNNKISAQFNCL